MFKHIGNCAYCKNYDKIYKHFKVLNMCNSYNSLLSTESLLVKKYQNNQNNQFSTDKGLRTTISIFKCFVLISFLFSLNHGFPKVGQVAPLGATSSKGVRGGP